MGSFILGLNLSVKVWITGNFVSGSSELLVHVGLVQTDYCTL